MKKIKKIALIFSVLCVLLTGCSLKDTSSVEIKDLGVYKYDTDNVTLFRRVAETLRLYIYMDKLNTEPEVDVILYTKDGELIAENDVEGIFKSDIELEFSKDHDFLIVTERITYYNPEDRERNFTYDKVTELVYQDLGYGFRINIPMEGSKDIKWNVFANIESLKDSAQYGIYNMYEVSYIIGVFTIIICTLISVFILWMKKRFSLLREKKFKIEPLFTGMICFLGFLLSVILAFKGEPVIIVIVIDVLLVIPFIAKLILLALKMKGAKQYELEKEERMKNLDDLYHYKKNK